MIQKELFSGCFPFFPVLIFFLRVFLSSEGKDLTEIFHLQLYLQGLTLCLMSGLVLFMCSHLLQEESFLTLVEQGTDL